ncbi:PEP-CTERM sorting domain-containing protein [Massilia sp. P8910]|uniref:PEP-CTERM sorting domain-containing protein n=1 Tax=Massilia antarctica TaxID=2765360 RepID=UPI001E61EC73|nr:MULTISPECIES: PEP-CTERM sorting domain-containing protein [Massilia]MCE3606849.1 PEP-CTERM sorting domain-containing protein [Massilia antarctica]MCY0916521.1 PEP-CTERM sorting domain-containing protein [Massilia sp. H27-R4]
MRAYLVTMLLAGVAASQAHAKLVTFDYTAVVNKATRRGASTGYATIDVPSISIEGKEIAVGDTQRGSFTIDLDTPTYDWRPENPTVEYRGSLNNIGSVSVDRSGYSFASEGSLYASGFSVLNQPSGDSFSFNTYSNNMIGHGSGFIRIRLDDTNGDLLGTNAPPESLNLAAAEWSEILYGYYPEANGDSLTTWGTLTALAVRPPSPVPEPASYAMLVAGLLTVGAAARAKARRKG